MAQKKYYLHQRVNYESFEAFNVFNSGLNYG